MSASNHESEAASNVTQNNTNSGKPRRPPPCWKYQTLGICPKGDACPLAHGRAQPKEDVAENIHQSQTPSITAEATTPGATEAPGESPSNQPRKKPNKKPKKRKGKGSLSPEEVKEPALAQPTAAKAESAKKVTIFSEDEEQTWTLERGFLSKHSKPLGLVLSYSGKQADVGLKDPIKSIRGLIRLGDGSGSLQLKDVKAYDFDIFLDRLRTTKPTELAVGDLKIILALASDWGFADLRDRIIHEIEKLHLNPIQRVALARRCKVAKWIRGALLSLTILLDPLNADEIQILGTTTAAAVWRAREKMFAHCLRVKEDRSTQQDKCPDMTCRQVICEVAIRVLERPGSAGKSTGDLSVLLKKGISASEMEDLCVICSSDAGLKGATSDVAEEVQIGKAILEDTFGKEDTRWLEPA